MQALTLNPPIPFPIAGGEKPIRKDPWKIVGRGSVVVKIYAQRRGKKLGPYTIAWRESANGRRQRAMRSDPASAVSFAEAKATALANGESWRLAVGQNDWASYQRSLELIAPLKQPLELVCGTYAQQQLRLPAGVTIADAVTFFLEHRPAGVTPKTIPEIATELVARKRAEGKGGKWLRTLEQQLGRFAGHFTGPMHSLQPHELNEWLCNLRGRKADEFVGLRTRKNYRDAIRELANYAKSRNYLDRDWSILRNVDDPEVQPTEIEIYTPEQIARLLAVCRPNMVPLLAIMCFAGVRHEEMSAPEKKVLVTWSNIDLAEGHIKVDKRAAKIKKQRIIKISPNLAAWLAPYARRSGPICEITHTGDALRRLGDRAKIPWIKNAPRKSFISYRLAQSNDINLTAREAGNSPGEIEGSYQALVTPEAAARWFNIFPPDDKDLLPLFDWAKHSAQAAPVS